MKKIILGCAAVLLSLGLLAGCNNEESDKAVSIKVDTAATVVVGEDLALPYTVEPEKAKVEVFNDHEEYVTASADVGLISLTGVAEGNATITLVGTYKKYTEANVSIAVSVVTKATEDTGPGEEEPGNTGDTEPGLPEIVLSVDPISTALIEGGDLVQVTYSVDPEDAKIEMEVANEAYATVEYLDPAVDDLEGVIETAGWYLTPVAEGETTLTVTASLDEYETASVEVAIKVHAADWEPLTEQTNYTLTVTFADEVPTYADAYICGYLEGGSTNFIEYKVGETGMMTVSEDRLSVSYEFTTIPVGEIIYNIYFEFNSNASSHEVATSATWEHHVFDSTHNSTFVVSDDSEIHGTEVTLEVVPTDIINDDVAAIELTIALKNTNTNNPQTGFTEGLAPSFYHWVTGDANEGGSTFVAMTQGACGSYTTDSDYYFTVSAEGTTEDGAGNVYSVDQGAEFSFCLVCQGGSSLWDADIILAESVQWSAELPISNAGDGGNEIKIDSGFLNGETNLLVLELDFATYDASAAWNTFNPIITGGSYYANWY